MDSVENDFYDLLLVVEGAVGYSNETQQAFINALYRLGKAAGVEDIE